MSSRKPCGKHTELVINAAVRISQCPCGTVYVTFQSNGVTLRLAEDQLRAVTSAFLKASDIVEENTQPAIN